MIRFFRNFPEEDQENWPSLETLAPIHQRLFNRGDPERFRLIWCTLAKLCGVDPLTLREDDVFDDLCPPPSRWTSMNERIEDIQEFALRQSSGKELPGDLRTVGAMLDWLL